MTHGMTVFKTPLASMESALSHIGNMGFGQLPNDPDAAPDVLAFKAFAGPTDSAALSASRSTGRFTLAPLSQQRPSPHQKPSPQAWGPQPSSSLSKSQERGRRPARDSRWLRQRKKGLSCKSTTSPRLGQQVTSRESMLPRLQLWSCMPSHSGTAEV